MTTALIVDDEPLLRAHLRAQLEALWPGLQRIDEAGNGHDALARFDDDAWPAACFLDIHMPDLSGLDVARRIRAMPRPDGARTPQIVFVTAYDNHAIEAFEHGAVDYLLKPFETDRLAESIERVRQRIASPARLSGGPDAATLERVAERLERLAGFGPASRRTLQWIKASIGSTVRLIPIDEVLYFHADDKYTRVLTADGEALIRKPIKELIAELDGDHFWQIHRATIVNTRAIAGVVRGLKDSADLKLKNRPETLTVSRAYLHLFRQM